LRIHFKRGDALWPEKTEFHSYRRQIEPDFFQRSIIVSDFIHNFIVFIDPTVFHGLHIKPVEILAKI
jgi:hypothetical protein